MSKSYEYWKPAKQIERRYNRSLQNITHLMLNVTANRRDPYKIISGLKILTRQQPFQDYCEQLARTMVTQLYRGNNAGWREAALQNGRGKGIHYAIMQELKNGMVGPAVNEMIAYNAAMIKTLPINIAAEFTDYVQYRALAGVRATDIADELRGRIPKRSKANIDLIARTEVSKTQCALIQARAESLSLDWYIWRTSEDSRVRSSHDFMDGVLVRWSEPPNPEALNHEEKEYGNYHAGNIWNCRCYPEPVVDISFISFPCDVYYNGRIIKRMKKAEFLKIA